MGFLIPLDILIPIALVIIILIVLLWIFFSKSKRLAGKIIAERKRLSLYKKHAEALRNYPQNPESDFKKLNQVTRAFFKEYFNLDYSLTYLELEQYFKKQKKQDYSKFCKLMSDVDYQGEKTSQQTKQLVELFYEIVNRY